MMIPRSWVHHFRRCRRKFCRWLHEIEPALRLIEVIAIVTGAFFIGLLTLMHDEERNRLMEAQTNAQKQLNDVIELRSNTGVVAALLSHFCSEKEMHRVISVIINTKPNKKENTNENTTELMHVIDENCKETLERLGLNLRQTEMEAAYNILNKRFLDAVSYGRIFFNYGLWDGAVGQWLQAAEYVPPFLPLGMINQQKLEEARKATDTLTKADLFKKAFEKVQ
jgi:hypothetical protein